MSDGDHKVVTVTQDYIILGKSTKETEIRINFDGSDYEMSRKKIANVIRLAAYAEGLNNNTIQKPPNPFGPDGKELEVK